MRKVVSVMRKWIGPVLVALCLFVILTTVVNAMRRPEPFRDTAYELFLWVTASLVTYFVARWYRNLKKGPSMTQSLEESEPLPEHITLDWVDPELRPMIHQLQGWLWGAMRPRPAVPMGGPAPPPEDMIATAADKPCRASPLTKRIRVSVAALVVGLVLAISCGAWAGAQIRTETKTVYYRPDLKIVVDSRQTALDVEPFIVDPGWIMVPAEFISKKLGATVAWDDATSTFTITTKGTTTWETRILPSGDMYVGQVKDGKRNGLGTYTWVNGDKYVGEHKDDQRNGQGTFTSADGYKYEGEWKDGKRDGLGTYTWVDGGKYEGEWKDDKRDGLGTYTWVNGDEYVGEWEDDKRDGLGAFRSANGHIQGGLWVNGMFASPGSP
jgi:hypothetical protein